MADLSDEEIAELRTLAEGGEQTALEWRAAVLAAHPFLLSEIERYRQPLLRSALSTAVHVLRTEGFRVDADRIAALLDHK